MINIKNNLIHYLIILQKFEFKEKSKKFYYTIHTNIKKYTKYYKIII